VNQGTQKQALPSAHDEPASSAGTKPYTRSQSAQGRETSEPSAAKTSLNRDKPGCSGIKSKLFFTTIVQNLMGHFDTGRQDFPSGKSLRLTGSTPLNLLKNPHKYAYERISSHTEK
jgi:hypothetical protein